MPGKKKTTDAPKEAKKSTLSDIKETCEKQQYCHMCKYRTFCTEIRAVKPRYWKNDSIEAVERIAND